MKIIVTGASGLVGKALIPYLKTKGHDVKAVIRSTEPSEKDEIRWNPEKGFIDFKDLADVDVVINLSGENIAKTRWTDEHKSKIYSSRVASTSFLSQILGSLERKPRLLINASAIGFYGDQGDKVLTENSPKGNGFLADVCQDWEKATEFAKRQGIRVVLIRTGMVLSSEGGALTKMLTPFSLGLGGKMGSGKQWWSWIAIDDVLGAINHIIDDNQIEGPVDLVSPNPVTNLEFTKALADTLKKPAFFPMPAFIARLVLGQMADELILASQRVMPEKLLKTNYTFIHPTLKSTLKNLLKK